VSELHAVFLGVYDGVGRFQNHEGDGTDCPTCKGVPSDVAEARQLAYELWEKAMTEK